MSRNKIKRYIPIEEVAQSEWYDDMADLALIFDHKVIEDDHGTWRWEEHPTVQYLMGDSDKKIILPEMPEWIGRMFSEGLQYNSVNLNNLVMRAFRKEFPLEDYMKFYMGIGYSLCGYAEVFGQREVTEFRLDYFEEAPEEHDFDEEYWETPIEYMRKKHIRATEID